MTVQTLDTGEAGYAGRKVDLVRALPTSLEVREATTGTSPTMFGHFAVFNRWTEIDSFFEGRFMERIAPGAFKKTIRENRDAIRVLAEHGYDPTIGKRALGTITVLREDGEGGYYEVDLVDAQDVRELVLPRLRAKLYGASFRFTVMREELVEEPDVSTDNPHGLPERTIKEARLFEFGPVTFPAYPEASANARGMRSLTDEFNAYAFVNQIARASTDPRMRRVMEETMPQEPTEPEERTDAEDLGTLAMMLKCGADYIADQDEPDEQQNVERMNGILATLAELIAFEAQEDEPVEPEDEEASADEPGETRDEPPEPTKPKEADRPDPALGKEQLPAFIRRHPDVDLYGVDRREPWRL
jgi:HK97 family phage prohead protease